jgi:CAAX prenyl protease-like protein
MATREGHGWWPYLLPIFVFLALGEIAGRFPEAARPAFLPLKVLLPGGLFVFYLRRGYYPELRGYPTSLRGVTLDVLVGVAGAALWMAPYIAMLWAKPAFWTAGWPEWLQPGADDAFDPNQLGASLVGLTLGLRCLGYGVVTPFVEELFVRSWLLRYVDVFDKKVDFRDVPIARFSWRSFLAVVVFFTISHVPWEWPVAVLWIVGTQLWFYHRGHLASLVIVHAGSNLSIFFFVLAMSGRLVDGAGAPIDLWFFI